MPKLITTIIIKENNNLNISYPKHKPNKLSSFSYSKWEWEKRKKKKEKRKKKGFMNVVGEVFWGKSIRFYFVENDNNSNRKYTRANLVGV